MAVRRGLRRFARGAIAPLLFLAVAGYFCWNAIQGDRGLVAYHQRQDLLQQAQTELLRAQVERNMWERRVADLRSNHLDRDTLDERARAMLNLADPNDIIVQYSPKDRLF